MRNRFSYRLVSALCSCVMLIGSDIAALAEAPTGKVASPTVNLRKMNSTDSDILVILNKDDQVEILSEINGFYKVRYGNTVGYIVSDYISISDTLIGKTGIITTNNVNFREGPATDRAVILTLNAKDEVTILGISGDFFYVSSGKQKGYVAINLVSIPDEEDVSGKFSKGTVCTVTVANVNLREHPSLSSAVLRQIQKSDSLTVVSYENGFYKVKCENITGYIAENYITVKATAKPANTTQPAKTPIVSTLSAKGYVVSETLNLRAGADTQTDILIQLKQNEQIQITGETADFYRVSYGKVTGYVMKKYIKLSKATEKAEQSDKTNEKKLSATGIVTSDSLNVREKASVDSGIVTKLTANSQVTIIAETDDFYKIQLNSKVGYVKKSFIRLQSNTNAKSTPTPTVKTVSVGKISKTGTVTSQTLNMRNDPTTDSAIVSVIPANTTLKLIGETNDFYQTTYNGRSGYVSKNYIKIVTATERPVQTKTASAPVVVKALNEAGQITVDTLNVRKQASTSSAVLFVINKSTSFSITGETKDFYRISTKNGTGFVAKQYVKLVTETAKATAQAQKTAAASLQTMNATGKVNSDTLNMRNIADKTGEIIQILKKGDSVQITGEVNGFYKVKVNGKTGYLAKNYVTIDKAETKATQAPAKTSQPTTTASAFTTLSANGKTTVSELNMRKEPSSSSASLMKLKSGSIVQIVAQNKEYYKVKYGSTTGYLSKQYVTIVKETPKPAGSSSTSSQSKYASVTSIAALGDAPGYLSYGNSGDDVEKLQQALKIKGFYTGEVNGKFGAATKEALIAYQKKAGIAQTGKADYTTIKKLFGKVSVTTAQDDPQMNGITSISQIKVPSTTKKGSTGSSVLALQQALKLKGYYKAPINSKYDDNTVAAVTAYQKARGLTADGEAGFDTIKAIFGENAANFHYKTEEIDWFKDGNTKIPKGAIVTVKDIATGKTFKAKRWSGANHADMEPLTASDTAIMKSIYGGTWSWTRHAILVLYKDHVYAASMNGMPHGTTTISNNNFDGHFCIHFTGSKTHGSKKVDPDHQNAIKRAKNATW